MNFTIIDTSTPERPYSHTVTGTANAVRSFIRMFIGDSPNEDTGKRFFPDAYGQDDIDIISVEIAIMDTDDFFDD
jgi:hypothetical protein